MNKRFVLSESLRRNIIAMYEGGDIWLDQIDDLVGEFENSWSIACHGVFDSTMSFVTAADKDDEPHAVLKLMPPTSEFFTKELAAYSEFGGAVAELLAADKAKGAMLIERVKPGNPLVELALANDVAATAIVANGLTQLWRAPSSYSFPTVTNLLDGFDEYTEKFGDDGPVAPHVFVAGRDVFMRLANSQTERVLLHGDLHHANILQNGDQWRAIDPQGLIGEREYDTAAAMRNPWALLEAESDLAGMAQRRARQYAAILDLDEQRILEWSFAQTVLSLCWQATDGRRLIPVWIRFANALCEVVS